MPRHTTPNTALSKSPRLASVAVEDRSPSITQARLRHMVDIPIAEVIDRYKATALAHMPPRAADQALESSTFSSDVSRYTSLTEDPLNRTNKTLEELIKSLSRHLSKFVYGTITNSEWDRRYKWPHRKEVDEYFAQLKKEGLPVPPGATKFVANRDKQSAEQWLASEILAPLAEATRASNLPVTFLLGGVGSGKSSFNKYLSTYHARKFYSAKVMSTRVECKKFSGELLSSPEFKAGKRNAEDYRDFIRNYIFRMLARDIVTYHDRNGMSPRRTKRLQPRPKCRNDICSGLR